MEDHRIEKIRQALVNYPDFPKKGIQFKDIFGIFQQPSLVQDTVDLLSEHIVNNFVLNGKPIDAVVGLEARGFLLGPMLALKLNCAFVPIRKAGKLPGECYSQSYDLEYGTAVLEISKTALPAGANVVIFDDLLAIGGTLNAACNLLKQASLNPVGSVLIIELGDLNGRASLAHQNIKIFSLIKL